MRQSQAQLLDRLVADATAFAYVLVGEPDLAVRLAGRAVTHALGQFDHFRAVDDLEASVRRRVLKLARLRRPRHDGHHRCWSALARLTVQDRAALALIVGDGMTREQAARVLDRPLRTVIERFDHACSELTRVSGITQAVDALAPVLAERAQDVAHARPHPGRLRLWTSRSLAVGVSCCVFAVPVLAAAQIRHVVVREGTRDAAEADTDHRAVVPRLEAFTFCPDPATLDRFGARRSRRAAATALRFNRALARDRTIAIARLVHPELSIEQARAWNPTRSTRGVRVTHSAAARSDALVIMECGEDLARRSWEVVMHDRTRTTTEGLARYYLVRLGSTWRVWAADPTA